MLRITTFVPARVRRRQLTAAKNLRAERRSTQTRCDFGFGLNSGPGDTGRDTITRASPDSNGTGTADILGGNAEAAARGRVTLYGRAASRTLAAILP